MNERFESLLSGLEQHGWAVSHRFLPETELRALAEEARLLHNADRFRPAEVGTGGAQVLREDMRSDSILWLNPLKPTPPQQQYLAAIEELRLALNRHLFLGVIEFECHYAVYEPGNAYEAHVDRHRDSDARVVSTALYLNHEWQPGDGGELRLHLESGPVDVPPEAGTFAVFLSDAILHEVLPARCDRYSLTGWFRRRSFTDIYP